MSQIAGGESEILYQWRGTSNLAFMGEVVANAGDVNADGIEDLIVGASGTRVGGRNYRGTATVFSGADGSMLYEWHGFLEEEAFGESVGYAGDVNSDGYADVIVGAKLNRTGGLLKKGAAFVFSGIDGALLHQTSGTFLSTGYSHAVGSAGDVNGDGADDFFASEPRSTLGGVNAGSVFIYSGATGAEISRWDGSLAYEEFGRGVANVGDQNQDGIDDLLIGAPANAAGTDIGWIYVVSGNDGSHLVEISRHTLDGDFGSMVSNAGDVNADGVVDYLVSSPNSHGGHLPGAGNVFVFSGADNSLLHEWQGSVPNEQLGRSLALAGDANGDGFDDVLIGSPFAQELGVWEGKVGIYSGRDGSLLQEWLGYASSGFGASLASLGDLNADGANEIAVGVRSASTFGLLWNGGAIVISFQTLMTADTFEISSATGGTLAFELNFPMNAGGYEYRIILSASGTGPSSYGVQIPLTQDNLVLESYGGNYSVPSSNMQGTLDAQGDATASITVPPGFAASQIGTTLHFAAIANPVGQLPEYSSVAVPLEIIH